MKTQKMNWPIKSILLAVFAILMIIPFTSYAKKIKFLNSTVVPSAKGFVKVKKGNNENYFVKVVVTDLAKVERLQSSKTTYMVWMETDQGKAENLGKLNSSTGFLSKRHNASLESVSPYKPVKIFITSENDTNVESPGEQVVLTTDTFYNK